MRLCFTLVALGERMYSDSKILMTEEAEMLIPLLP